MKLIKYLMIAAVAMTAWSCTPDDDYPALEEPISLKPEVLNGTWRLNKIVHVDQEALDNGFPDEVTFREITDLFPFDEYQITFNISSTNQPTTYVVNPGNAPNFLRLSSGNWALDHPVFATNIRLTNPAAFNSSEFRVKQISSRNLILQIVRRDVADDTIYSYYEMTFSKLN